MPHHSHAVKLTPVGPTSPAHLPSHSKLRDLPARHALRQLCDLRTLLPVVKLSELQAPVKEKFLYDVLEPKEPKTRAEI